MREYAYIGCRTTKERNARGKGIRVYEIIDGTWTLRQILEGPVNPSYLCLNEAQDRLYTVHGDFEQVSAFQIHENGELSYLNTVKTHGTNPVHLSLDKTGKWMFVANLQTGGISVIPVKEDGSLDQIHDLMFLSGNGGPGYVSHPHQVTQDRTGKWLLVPSQGRLQGVGKITVFSIDSENGILKEAFVKKARSGAEPRHCVFHPNNRFCYCVNEKDSTAAFYLFDEETGTLEPQQILTSLPEKYTGDGWASAIEMGKDGRFLYLSNRKHDSVTVYSINQETGYMTYLQNLPTKGQQPRFITRSQDGTRLFAANELTDSICCMKIDSQTGLLSYEEEEIFAESPVCIVFKTK